jgi:hypothetical protein
MEPVKRKMRGYNALRPLHAEVFKGEREEA